MTAQVSAYITTKGKKYYIVVTWYQEGKRQSKWIKSDLLITGNNKRKAEKMRLDVLREYEEKLCLNNWNVLFSDYLKQWLEDTKNTISENTYYSYKNTIYNTICPYFEKQKIKLCELKPYQIQEFYNKKMNEDGVSANTIHHYHANISKALNYAVKTECIKSNPAKMVELPKKKKYIADFYTVTELKTLLSVVKGTDMETVVLLAGAFGLRRGEIIGLKWDCIDFERNTLSVLGTMQDKGESGSKLKNMHFVPTTKTDASLRTFTMPHQVANHLKDLKAKQEDNRRKLQGYNHQWDEFVCVRQNGDIIPLEYVSRTLPIICKKHGLKRITIHELRHTNISMLIEEGWDLKVLQEWAGHSSYVITANIYSHIRQEHKKKVTETITNLLF